MSGRGIGVWLLLLAGATAAHAGAEGENLLAAALAHHDPDDGWADGRFELTLEGKRPDGSTTVTVLLIDNQVGLFGVRQERPEGLIEARIGPGEECMLSLDGSTEMEEQVRAELRLDCDRYQRLRNYYLYMWGLPMKLSDEGTLLGEVGMTDFQGTSTRSLRVTYEEAVGGDVWYFYFDPETSKAVGYRFFHDEAANDGEYILLEGEVEAGGVRFPRLQTWHMNADDKLLGSDELVSARRLR